jgi:hybrid cluster-associated redox disulfide protein
MSKTFNLSGSVESLFERWPGTVQVFIQHQMACPGCHLAEFESLESALEVYQVEHEPFFDDLQQVISENKSSEREVF